ncbi:MFS transporter [Dactylosporangium sp. CA-092794]|uniref:MFS transporter n=1 Tax=Dactylosporangium sp. CA-092794 TaxID=3239929 RepID=UPI003D8E19E1
MTETGTVVVPAPDPPGMYLTGLRRFGPLTLLGALSWALPAAASGTLLQALFARMDAADKIKMTAIVSTVAAIAGAAAVVVAGALSDRTRSRFGPRKPWILGGALAGAVSLGLAAAVQRLWWIVVCYALFQLGLNCMVAALSALLPDRVGASLLGRASAFGGLGNLLGNAVGAAVAGGFLSAPRLGLALAPWTMVAVALIFWGYLPSRPNTDVPRPPLSGLWRSLRPPADRDFWLVFLGRVAFLLALLVVFAYQLYLLTDYFHATQRQTAAMIGASGLVLALGAGLATVLTGFLSDRAGRRKPFLVGAAGFMAVTSLVPLFVHSAGVFLPFLGVVALAYGTFISVDQALMVEVLPSRDNSARDLGFLTVANTAPGIVAPGLAGVLVATLGYPALFVAGIALALVAVACIAAVRRVR